MFTMDEDWLLYFTTTFTFTVIFVFCYIRYIYTFFERNKIPKPTAPSFPFGNVYDVISQKTPMFMQLWKFYNRFKRKKCSMGGFYIYLKPAILMMDTKQTEMILSGKKSQYFSDGDDSTVFAAHFTDSLLFKICENIQRIWPRLVSNLPEEEEEEEVNLSHVMCHNNVEIVQELFNVKLFQWPEERDSKWSLLKRFFFLSYPNLSRVSKNGTICVQILDDLTKNENEDGNKDSFRQMLLKSGLSRDEMNNFIFCVIENLIKANHLLLFTLYELSDNEEIQDDLRGEITRFRKNRSPSNYYNELSSLTYLETVICETLRKYPSDPFVYKICQQDYADSKVRVMKNSLVFVSTFGIHHDGQNYINPELFDPDRFSEENLKFIDATRYLPFGCKRTNSFDALYVKLLMKISLLELLSRFEFSYGKKSPKSVQFDGSVFGFLKMKEDVWLKVKKL